MTDGRHVRIKRRKRRRRRRGGGKADHECPSENLMRCKLLLVKQKLMSSIGIYISFANKTRKIGDCEKEMRKFKKERNGGELRGWEDSDEEEGEEENMRENLRKAWNTEKKETHFHLFWVVAIARNGIYSCRVLKYSK